MKFFKFILFSVFSTTYACGQAGMSTTDIAALEGKKHRRLLNLQVMRESAAGDNYDVNYYRCEWAVDPAVNGITGRVTVYFTARTALAAPVLDMSSALVFDSAFYHAGRVTATRAANAITVNLPTTVQPAAKDSFTIYYHGAPANTGFGSFIQSRHNNTPVIWTLSEPYGAMDWWPCKNNLSDKADSIDIFVTHPVGTKAASNGLRQWERSVDGKLQTWWKHRYPIASYLVCFAVTNFEQQDTSVVLGNVTLPMQTFAYPENAALFRNNTAKVLSAMSFFHNTYGDYPFLREKYGHVQFGWGGGMEHQTATFIVSPDENLMAHELGHQWFGDKVTCASWRDVWLNEGFATYLARENDARLYPNSAVQRRRAVVNDIISQPGGSVWVDDTTNINRIFSGRLSYNKGSFLAEMLSVKLGKTVFTNGLKRYLDDPAVRYGFARTEDLQRNLEAESGKSLTAFFNEWYRGEGYPTFTATWTKLGTWVKVKLAQQSSMASNPFFHITVPLRFVKGTQTMDVLAVHESNEQVFVFNLPFSPDTLLIDPEVRLVSGANKVVQTEYPNNGSGGIDMANPVEGNIDVLLHDFGSASSAELVLLNMAGQKVYSANVGLQSGAARYNIPSGRLAAGMYILKVNAGGVIHQKKIIRK